MNVNAVTNLEPIKIPKQNLASTVSLPNTQTPVLNNVQTPVLNSIQPDVAQTPKKLDLLKKFETSVKNKCDMNDTVQVPRTIFKGYLSFMIGTALGGINNLIKIGENGKNKSIKTLLAAASILVSLFGTWSFVRPYVIKDSQKKD